MMSLKHAELTIFYSLWQSCYHEHKTFISLEDRVRVIHMLDSGRSSRFTAEFGISHTQIH
jgi:hypothetical protein